MQEDWINWVGSTDLSYWVTSGAWTWPIMETMHFFGMSLLLGSLLVIDLRLMGFFKRISIHTAHKLLPYAFIGFGINLVTGILFYFGDPWRYTINISFRIKMLLVLLAGINALLFYFLIDKKIPSWEAHGSTPGLAKAIGFSSLGLWFGVLILGRLIPYLGTG